jgi:hypothetical protein
MNSEWVGSGQRAASGVAKGRASDPINLPQDDGGAFARGDRTDPG